MYVLQLLNMLFARTENPKLLEENEEKKNTTAKAR